MATVEEEEPEEDDATRRRLRRARPKPGSGVSRGRSDRSRSPPGDDNYAALEVQHEAFLSVASSCASLDIHDLGTNEWEVVMTAEIDPRQWCLKVEGYQAWLDEFTEGGSQASKLSWKERKLGKEVPARLQGSYFDEAK